MIAAETWSQHGIPGAIIGAILTLEFFIIRRNFDITKEIMKQAAEERKSWVAAIEKINMAIDEHNVKTTGCLIQITQSLAQTERVLSKLNDWCIVAEQGKK